MEMTSRMLENGDFTLSGVCPHCQTKALFKTVTSSYKIEINMYRHERYERYACMQCHACGKFILGSVAQIGAYSGAKRPLIPVQTGH